MHATSGNGPLARLGPIPRDGLAAAASLATVLACASLDEKGPSITFWHAAIATATCVPLVVRSLWPLPVLAAVVAGTFGSIAAFDPNMTIALPVGLALYTVALTSNRATRLVVAGAVVPVGVVLISLFSPYGIFTGETLKNLGLALLPLALGSAKRDHRAYIEAIEERAERAERTREEEALRRVGEERLRIARELHDVVAHAMVAINVQAGVAAHLIDRRPESARGALEQIKRVSGEALTDLRATLGVLRHEEDMPAPTRPAPGLDALEELADGMRAAGVEVAIELSGSRCTVPSAVASALFRTTQEALTNVLRHSGSRAATVRVEVRKGTARVEILDDGPAHDAPMLAGEAAPAGAAVPAAGVARSLAARVSATVAPAAELARNGAARVAPGVAPAAGLAHNGAARISATPAVGDGTATPPDARGPAVGRGTGNGLRGMRERIAALGGVVEAGPREGGGWRVHALLPLPPEQPPQSP